MTKMSYSGGFQHTPENDEKKHKKKKAVNNLFRRFTAFFMVEDVTSSTLFLSYVLKERLIKPP